MSATIAWRDGLELTRVTTIKRTGRAPQIVLWLTWQGVTREVRLGKGASDIRRLPKPEQRAIARAKRALRARTDAGTGA